MEKTPHQPCAHDDKPSRYRFIFPLMLPIPRSDHDPLVSRLCKGLPGSLRIPESSVGFGAPAPIDDVASELPANLLVSFVLQQMQNEVVSGNGVDAICWGKWETHSPVATVEYLQGGPFTLPVPGPGETWPTTHNNSVYAALVHNGCGNTPVFPVEFTSSVGEMEDLLSPYVQIGEFSAVDDTTLQPNGFWSFSYTIRATGTNGGVSDFKFKGAIGVTCTLLNSF